MQPDPGLAQTLEGSRAAPALERLKSGKSVGPMVQAERRGTGGWRGGGGVWRTSEGQPQEGRRRDTGLRAARKAPASKYNRSGAVDACPAGSCPFLGVTWCSRVAPGWS